MTLSILGWGAALPDTVVTNDDLSRHLATDDAWIVERTGIRRRHRAAPTDTTLALAAAAGARALERAGVDAAELDLVVVATCTPDRAVPSAAASVAHHLGASSLSFDLNAACCGSVVALHVAERLLASPRRRGLVVGVDRMSTLVDPSDRDTAVLFGDAAAAVVVAGSTPSAGPAGCGGADLGSDPQLHDALLVPDPGGWLRMDGRAVFRAGVRVLADSGARALVAAGLEGDDVAWFVPHQANLRIIDAAAARLGFDDARVVRTVDRHANTSAASIPLALSDLGDRGQARHGEHVLLAAVGAGFGWASLVVRWGAP